MYRLETANDSGLSALVKSDQVCDEIPHPYTLAPLPHDMVKFGVL